MYRSLAFAISLASVLVRGQQVGTNTAETHPTMTWQTCTAPGSCTTKNGKIVIDSNWRWVHDKTSGKYTNCYDGNTWDATLCPDNQKCAANCALEGADYGKTYGASTSGNALKLTFITKGEHSTNIGSRMYLMESDTKYQMFSLLNKEFTFDVDLSNLPCGLNGALYFVSMDADGGMAKYPNNKGGAKYGTGYCDAQCTRDLKFINGEANVAGWKPSSNDPNAGVGDHGSCCSEMDIWEANSISAAYTPHSCLPIGQGICDGDTCGGTYSADRYSGACDADGCDFNSYRMGDTGFYGPGLTVDTKKKMTVVTQFIGDPLTEIKRFYVQDGKLIPNSQSTIPGVSGNSITTAFCDAQKAAFGDNYKFKTQGGLAGMGNALKAGMVLVMSIWDDHYSNMLWLDSTYPTDSTKLGAARGSCDIGSGVPADVEAKSPASSVTYSNIKFGPINSTFAAK
ncbi:probable Probable 1,4-beta-D-glucan cellobiohydrolase A [Rhynchosporium agropyri]|uniref:Glucanase n=1 Tax=Rhynchosporium agropyri TaxID=914238 RepID=A0A1E1L300_9HELO|nr:probable Probable 1,4-beta-D-glucan cellobiohydrolase A [Rhynchosporium agropyri]